MGNLLPQVTRKKSLNEVKVYSPPRKFRKISVFGNTVAYTMMPAGSPAFVQQQPSEGYFLTKAGIVRFIWRGETACGTCDPAQGKG